MRFSTLARARLPLVLLAALAGGSALAQAPAAETEARQSRVRSTSLKAGMQIVRSIGKWILIPSFF